MKKIFTFLIVLITVSITFIACSNEPIAKIDDWEWSEPADWRLPLISKYSVDIMQWISSKTLNGLGNAVSQLPDKDAQKTLSNFLKEKQDIKKGFSPNLQTHLQNFENDPAKSNANDIGNLINDMTNEASIDPKLYNVIGLLFDDILNEEDKQNFSDKLKSDAERGDSIEFQIKSLIGSMKFKNIERCKLSMVVIDNKIPLKINFQLQLLDSLGKEIRRTMVPLVKDGDGIGEFDFPIFDEVMSIEKFKMKVFLPQKIETKDVAELLSSKIGFTIRMQLRAQSLATNIVGIGK